MSHRKNKILASKAAKFQRQLSAIENKQAKYCIQEPSPKRSQGSILARIITDELADDWQSKTITYLTSVYVIVGVNKMVATDK